MAWHSKHAALALAGVALSFAAALLANAPAFAVETIVIIRHGEKPAGGFGQLACQGLNRALALPPVLAAAFDKPSAIFAPNPSDRKSDQGTPYDYIRPLATIEPTAIALGMPVDTRFGLSGLDGLQQALVQEAYRDATVLVAWEHRQIVSLARNLLASHGGDPETVPEWGGDDFDSIYIVTIDASGAQPAAKLQISHEGLNGLPDQCPTAPAHAG